MARTLSTADARREALLEAALPLFAEKGITGTPTLAVAKASGISQAYLFRRAQGLLSTLSPLFSEQ